MSPDVGAAVIYEGSMINTQCPTCGKYNKFEGFCNSECEKDFEDDDYCPICLKEICDDDCEAAEDGY